MNDKRNYDLIIFGASGFTGQFVVSEVQRIASAENIKWAVAGRSRDKLNEVVSKRTESSGDSFSDIITADINDYQSLLLMCRQTKVVLDCVGPYRFYGEPVVKACVEAKTSYVDICGEPLFIDSMLLKYNDGAEKSGIYIVSACGFDSIPSELGVLYAKQQFSGTLNGIKAYFNFKVGQSGGCVHFGTYESAIYVLKDEWKSQKVQKQLDYEPLPLVGPKLKSEFPVHYKSPFKRYAIPFEGVDMSMVEKSQRFLYKQYNEPPIQYSLFTCVNSFFYIPLIFFLGFFLKLFALTSWGRYLLLKYPKFFTAGFCSAEGPTAQQMDQTFFSLTMFGEGYSEKNSSLNRSDKPDKKIVIKVSGPEPGYYATSVAMVQSAVVMVKEQEKLPVKGGVYSPGAAFFKTSLINRLHNNGMKFEVLG